MFVIFVTTLQLVCDYFGVHLSMWTTFSLVFIQEKQFMSHIYDFFRSYAKVIKLCQVMPKLSSFVELCQSYDVMPKFCWSYVQILSSYAKVMKLSWIMPKLGSFATPMPKISKFHMLKLWRFDEVKLKLWSFVKVMPKIWSFAEVMPKLYSFAKVTPNFLTLTELC